MCFTYFKSISSIRILLYRSHVIHFFYFSGTFLASEYLFSAPRGLFILVALSPLPSICAASRGLFSALLEDSLFWSYFPRFRVSAQRLEDSCRAPRGLFILVVLSPLPSICAAPRGLKKKYHFNEVLVDKIPLS